MFHWFSANKDPDDWQKKIEKGRKKLADQEEKRNKEFAEREHRKYLANLAALQRSFSCCVCHRRATRPKTYTYGSDEEHISTEVDWDIPGDLSQCPRCKRWVCYEDTCSVSQREYEYVEKYWGLYRKVLEPGNYCKTCALWLFS